MPSMAFQSNMYVRNNGKVGMLKANGEDFIPVKYDSLGMYSDNMLVAKVGDKYGFLNEEGKESVPFVYSQAHNYSEGLAAVVNEMANISSLTNRAMLLSSQRNMTEWTIFRMALAKFTAKIKFGRLTEKVKR